MYLLEFVAQSIIANDPNANDPEPDEFNTLSDDAIEALKKSLAEQKASKESKAKTIDKASINDLAKATVKAQ